MSEAENISPHEIAQIYNRALQQKLRWLDGDALAEVNNLLRSEAAATGDFPEKLNAYRTINNIITNRAWQPYSENAEVTDINNSALGNYINLQNRVNELRIQFHNEKAAGTIPVLPGDAEAIHNAVNELMDHPENAQIVRDSKQDSVKDPFVDQVLGNLTPLMDALYQQEVIAHRNAVVQSATPPSSPKEPISPPVPTGREIYSFKQAAELFADEALLPKTDHLTEKQLNEVIDALKAQRKQNIKNPGSLSLEGNMDQVTAIIEIIKSAEREIAQKAQGQKSQKRTDNSRFNENLLYDIISDLGETLDNSFQAIKDRLPNQTQEALEQGEDQRKQQLVQIDMNPADHARRYLTDMAPQSIILLQTRLPEINQLLEAESAKKAAAAAAAAPPPPPPPPSPPGDDGKGGDGPTPPDEPDGPGKDDSNPPAPPENGGPKDPGKGGGGDGKPPSSDGKDDKSKDDENGKGKKTIFAVVGSVLAIAIALIVGKKILGGKDDKQPQQSSGHGR